MEGQERILIIDDDVDFVAATKTILESNAYDVITANRGVEGLDTAKLEKPDLIILDVIMPAMDGFTVAEQLKKDPEVKNIPVIMLTAFSTKRHETSIPANRGLTLEAEDYMEKPVSPDELLSRVKQNLK